MRILRVITVASYLLIHSLALGGPITYQGRLEDNGQPANGLYSMRFAVFDDLVAGNALGTAVTVANIPVADGLFTARFDVDDVAIAEANEAWLQIEVFRLGSGFEVLSPRQPMDPPPLARQAAGALKLENGDVVFQRGGAVQTMANTLGTPPVQVFPTSTSAWQSFTATADGTIADAWVQLDLVGAESVEFRVYAGEGTGGNLLATDAAALVDTANGNTFGASPAAQVTEGQLYTLEIVGLASQGTSPTLRIPFGNLGYTGGKANRQPQDGSPAVNDYFFRVRVELPGADVIVAKADGTLRTNGLVVTNPTRVDLGLNAVQMDEIEGEPGTAVAPNAGEPDLVETSGLETVLVTETIGVPAMPGRIIAMFSGTARVDLNPDQNATDFNIQRVNNGEVVGSARLVMPPQPDANTAFIIPVSLLGVDEVNGGALTYEVVAINDPDNPTTVFNMQFHLFWMPTKYDVDLPEP